MTGWCAWCADHPERAYPADKSAITDSVFIGVTIFVHPDGTLLHIHGATVVSPDQLTLRGTLRRLYRNRFNRLVDKTRIRQFWAWSNRSIGRAA